MRLSRRAICPTVNGGVRSIGIERAFQRPFTRCFSNGPDQVKRLKPGIRKHIRTPTLTTGQIAAKRGKPAKPRLEEVARKQRGFARLKIKRMK